MPFQAIPIAMNSNPGTPLSKLLWIHMVDRAILLHAPNGKAYYETETYLLARFCQATKEEVISALNHLERCGLISVVNMRDDDSLFIDLNLPVSDINISERKRIKATPDQIAAMAERASYRCAACGETDYDLDRWHVDHIIPRSVGGADVEENCQLLCQTCNNRKGAKVHWVDFLGGRR